jgi:integrase
MLIGNIPLRDLTAHDVRRALNELAKERSTRTMASTHNVLVRAIRHAEANDHVGRNVASFVKPPQGKTGWPSRAMAAAEAAALLAAAKDHARLGAYVILSLTTGIRTEEARALRWDHVDLDGDPDARTPVPPSIAVWRSVQLHRDHLPPRTPPGDHHRRRRNGQEFHLGSDHPAPRGPGLQFQPGLSWNFRHILEVQACG